MAFILMREKIKMNKQVLELKNIFEEKGMTLALAESCTGGMLSAEIVSEPGVSSFFMGSVVSYSSEVKKNVLDVPDHLIKTLGEVSLPVAKAMAQGVRDHLNSNWGVSITGIAGPNGGQKDKPVGTVCFAVVGPGFEKSIKKEFKIKNRNEIQQASIDFALDYLLESFQQK